MLAPRDRHRPFSCSTSSDCSPAILAASFSRSCSDNARLMTARLPRRRTHTSLCCRRKANLKTDRIKETSLALDTLGIRADAFIWGIQIPTKLPNEHELQGLDGSNPLAPAASLPFARLSPEPLRIAAFEGFVPVDGHRERTNTDSRAIFGQFLSVGRRAGSFHATSVILRSFKRLRRRPYSCGFESKGTAERTNGDHRFSLLSSL